MGMSVAVNAMILYFLRKGNGVKCPPDEQEAMAHQLGISFVQASASEEGLFMRGCRIMAEMMRCVFLGLVKHDWEISSSRDSQHSCTVEWKTDLEK